MNCAIHTEVPAAAFCRTCGKAMCETCKRDVRGVIYCEDCLAAHMQSTMPAVATAPAAGVAAPVLAPVTGSSPGLAGVLAGFFPFGVGAVYNGQYMKGLVHLAVFVGLVWAVDHAGPMDFVFGIGIAFFYVYQIIDAVRTARARQYGLPLPGDIFGLQQLPAAPAENRAPVGAIVLIALGALFLLGNIGLFNWYWFGKAWPVVLIALGVWLFLRRREEETAPAAPAPPTEEPR